MENREELNRLKAHNPNRYCADGKDGQWCCPPGAAYAQRLGLYYRVHLQRRLIGCFSETFSFWKTTCESPQRFLQAIAKLSVRMYQQTTGKEFVAQDVLQVIRT
jgi:hypothetical protein